MKEFVWRSVLSAVLLAGFATEAEDILLKVTDAQLAGENIRVDDGLKISHWQFGETATWEFEIARPQRMNVIISYATPKGTRGFAIVDGNTLPRAPLYETEGWDQFKEASMGFIDLAPGNHSITIKPGNRVGGFVQLNQLRISTEQLIAQRVLTPADAKLHGASICRSETNDLIQDWGVNESADWIIDCQEGGMKDLLLTYACPTETRAVIKLDECVLFTKELTPTKGWTDFRLITIARGNFPAGIHKLLITSWDMKEGAFIHLKQLEIKDTQVPVAASRKP